jgi:hypothetical protein
MQFHSNVTVIGLMLAMFLGAELYLPGTGKAEFLSTACPCWSTQELVDAINDELDMIGVPAGCTLIMGPDSFELSVVTISGPAVFNAYAENHEGLAQPGSRRCDLTKLSPITGSPTYVSHTNLTVEQIETCFDSLLDAHALACTSP